MRVPALYSFRFSLVLAMLLAGSRAVAQSDLPPSLFIEAYPDRTSVTAKEDLAFHTSTTAAEYSLEIARIGAKREVVFQKSGIPGGGAHPIPEHASANGCGWPISFSMPVPAEWKSGYYTATFKVSDGGGKFVARNRRTAEMESWFIVRPSSFDKNVKILLQLATNTYNAYNNWGGFSVYAYNSLSNNQGHRVSFERPPASQFLRWELPFVKWAEENGYELEFAANSDLEWHPELLAHYKLVLSVGHDEYWSAPMRDHLENWIGKGGNVAFFSGNTCCWQVRSEDEGRAFTCWKQNYHLDPIFQTQDFQTLSTLWSHHLVKRPENALTGVGFLWGGYRRSHGQFMEGPAAYEVHRPAHWVLAETGLKAGDLFGDQDTVVGYECDGCELEWKDGVPYPTGRDGTPASFEVLATCPVRWHPDDAEWYERWEKGRTGAACMGLYTRGGTVFTAGTTDWSHGLRGGDPMVQQITRNLLDRLSK
jgi:hypothetical protein